MNIEHGKSSLTLRLAQDRAIDRPDDAVIEGRNALELLQNVYHNTQLPLSTRIRCAVEALPFEAPKLSAVALASMSEKDFAAKLDRAIARSGKLIDAKAMPQTE